MRIPPSGNFRQEAQVVLRAPGREREKSMAEYREQEKDLVFALDIGTRSIIGVVGEADEGRFKVLAIEAAEHGRRAMIDGQIDDIEQVAALARVVTDRLEERLRIRLRRVCVAAAGRALRTQSGSFTMELPSEQSIDADIISRLEAGAVSAAEEALQLDEEARQQMFLVGYTVAQYRLDNYPLSNLQQHSGKKVEADVVATFLPGEVVESLYATMRTAGLQVASMTLEPIAAMNAVIPADLRLLNLALVDIGAGTTDIALCRAGSVVGYTMATIAGDEITEAIMQALLVDFATAEQIKRTLDTQEEVVYTNILGLEETVSAETLHGIIQEPMERLADAIAKQILGVNGSAPSAVFLAGGGSKLSGFLPKVAKGLEMDERRVALAGNNFSVSIFADDMDLKNPEYATPLGIAVSAGLGLLNDSYMVMLNGQPAKLFRNGALTLRDILLMNGYSYSDMLGKSGRNLSVTLDGRRMVFHGEPGVPAALFVNEEEAAISSVIHAGDKITFVPAKEGKSAEKTLGELLGKHFSGRVLVNNEGASLNTPLHTGDTILTLDRPAAVSVPAPHQTPAESPVSAPAAPVPQVQSAPVPVAQTAAAVSAPVAQAAPAASRPAAAQPRPVTPVKKLQILLNGAPLVLDEKKDGSPYYLMDLLEYSGIDFDHVDRPVVLEVNDVECGFQHVVKNHDSVKIHCLE